MMNMDLLMMNRLFTCKIKEHKDFTLAPLAPKWCKSKIRVIYPKMPVLSKFVDKGLY